MALAVINQTRYNVLWWNWYFTKCWSNCRPEFAPDKKQSSVQWMSSRLLNVLLKLNSLYIIYQMGFKRLRTTILHKGNPYILDNRVKTLLILITLYLVHIKNQFIFPVSTVDRYTKHVQTSRYATEDSNDTVSSIIFLSRNNNARTKKD